MQHIWSTFCRTSVDFQAFRELLATPSLPLEAGFSCVLTVVRILSGAGRVLSVDDSAFTAYLVTSLPRLAYPGCEKDIPLALDCVDALLLRRRELAVERVGVVVKHLVSIAPHVSVHFSLAILSVVRTLLVRYPTHQQVCAVFASWSLPEVYFIA
jgi:nucleolar complex protein 3